VRSCKKLKKWKIICIAIRAVISDGKLLPIFSKEQNDSFCPLRLRVFRDRVRFKIYLSIGANIVE